MSFPTHSDLSQNDAEMLEEQHHEMQRRHEEEQQKPIVQSVQFRKPGEKWRLKLRKRPRGRRLWRRRRERGGR